MRPLQLDALLPAPIISECTEEAFGDAGIESSLPKNDTEQLSSVPLFGLLLKIKIYYYQQKNLKR